MSKIKSVTLGADPEFFLFDKLRNEVVSAEGLIGGTKNEPKIISEVGHSIQEDNVMVEYNIPPCIDSYSFSREIAFVIDYISKVTAPHLVPYISASAILADEFLKSEQALMFGCEPDFNVWTRSENASPSSSTNLRTAGGHIHIGYAEPSLEDSEEIVKAMDLFLGVPSILIDTDKERRKMYGKAGAFRFKPYGVEYRTLSNFWITNALYSQWAFEQTLLAIEFINSGNTIEIDSELSQRIVNTINNCDEVEALKLVEEFKLKLVKPIKKEDYEYAIL